ncbi:MAG: TlpA family protein disulfide reductase [Bacteroidales bacterium]|jgi:peroxiredoxin|nr:TlpA family protein disulfide reductase [Bacteroidales bacterium]
MKRILVSAFIILSLCATASPQTDTTTLTKVGDKAPAFSCKTTDGKSFDLAKQKGKIVLINFFATWCGPCNSELPVLQKNIWEKYRNNKSFSLIILGREHTAEEVSAFVKTKGFTMPFAPDPGREIFKLYATQSIPRNVIVGKDGKIIFQSIGYSPEEFKKVEEVLAREIR